MDAKITKLRLGRMLSYDWLKIAIATAAVIVAWMLIFTVTSTSIMPSQQFTVHNYVGNVSLTDGEFSDMNGAAFKDGVFSYEVIEGTTVDLSTNSDMASTLLQARMAVEEGDVMFIADSYDYRGVTVEEIVNEDTDEITYNYEFGYTYLQQFISSCAYQLFDINKYLDEMRAFVGQYYADGDYRTPTELNEQKIKDDFNARTKKDKRFRKSSARRQGEKDEIERIQKYREALVKFEWYLEHGVVALTETTLPDYFGEGEDFKGTFSINMCPTLDKGGMTVDGKPAMNKLMNAIAYKPIFVNEENELDYSEKTAENMNVCIFDFKGVTDSFEYESLSYLVFIIDRYSAEVCPEYIYA